MASLIQIKKSEGNELFPKEITGVLKKYELSSGGGKRYIKLELYTEADWKVLDNNDDFIKLFEDKSKSKEFADDFMRMIEI